MLIATWRGLVSPWGKDPDHPDWPVVLHSRVGTARPGVGVRLGYPARDVVVGPLTRPREQTRSARWAKLLRRNLNVAAAALLIVFTLPIMILIALAVRLSSPGPVIFTQPRVGVDRRRDDPNVPVDPRRREDHGGRVFWIYKFRTMRPRSNGDNGQRWASEEPERITTVGRILRRYRLDELPQLFNVLKGDMNLVGPRPEQPEIFKQLRDEIDGYQQRQRVLPGITGLAQVNHHYDHCVEDVRRKVTLDLAYVERESPLEDLRIMAQTVPVVLLGKGAT